MKQRTTILLTATFIGATLIACLSASAQLVYVKCCVKKNYDRYCFGPMMTSPTTNWSPFNWRNCHTPGPKCVYGFGPGSTSVALQEAMCNHHFPDNMPDQTDCVCSEWQDDSIEIVDLCWQWGGSGGAFYRVVYDYDGDGDLDLRDFAQFQIAFDLDENPPWSFQWCLDDSGPDNPCPRGCGGFDYDGDQDVDLYDWSQYILECPGGPGVPPC